MSSTPATDASTFADRLSSLEWHRSSDVQPRLARAAPFSAGVAVASPGDTQQQLLERADRHLYAAKTLGRDRVVV